VPHAVQLGGGGIGLTIPDLCCCLAHLLFMSIIPCSSKSQRHALLFDCCFSTDSMGEDEYRDYLSGIVVNHLDPFGNVLVINDNCLWTNDSWRNKNAGLDHREQEMLKNHTHWLWIR
jgi:hypothetical protein